MKIFLFLTFILFVSFFSVGQSDSTYVRDTIYDQYYMKTDLSLLTGYQLHSEHFAEIGIGVMRDGVVGHHPSTMIYGVTNEFIMSNDFVWGLKAGLWLGGGVGGMNIGLNLINYTDFESNTIRFRPEIGMGFSSFRIVYGYNLAITNKDFDGINTHNFTLNIILKMKTLKEESR